MEEVGVVGAGAEEGEFVEGALMMGTVVGETVGDVRIWLVWVVESEEIGARGEMAWIVWEVDVYSERLGREAERVIGVVGLEVV